MNIILTAINAKFIHSCLAVYSLHAFLDEEKQNVQIKEFTVNHSEEFIVSELYKLKPDVLAFSCYIWNFELVKCIVKTLKKIIPNVKIILGGPEVSYEYEELFLWGADVLVLGEGEQPFKDLVNDLLNNKPIAKIYKTEKSVQLDSIPFPYQNGFADFNNRIIYYETSRGCINSCGYCLSSATKGVKLLPIDRIKQDLSKFLSAKVNQVKFVDRTFNCNKRHAMDIWLYLIENDNKTTNFHFEIAGDLSDNEMLTLLSKARKGLFQFEIGVQSTNKKTLKEINRTTDTTKLFENVCKIKELQNIHLHLDLIVGLPHEDYQSFIKSFNDVMECRPNKMQVGFLKLLKGCAMRNNSAKYKIEHKDNAPYEILSNDCMDFETINKLKKIENMVDMFYNSDGFSCFVKYMINKYETPFHFFEALSTYWDQNGYHLVSHKRMALYTILYEFGQENEIVSELLKFDMLLHDNIRTFPEWIASYYQYDHKQITRTTGIHTFKYDILNHPIQKKEIKILFDYSQDKEKRATITQ